MKAILCKAYGLLSSLTLEEVPSPAVGDDDVKIAVRAAGVNFPDVLMVQGKYQRKPDFPFIPGIEVSGDVIEIGAKVNTIKVGQRVIGIANEGGFAQEIVLPSELVLPMPAKMTYEHGAVFPIVYGTSHLALHHRAKLQAGETLLVLGAAGGVGLSAVEIGKLMGATVIAAASTADKLILADEYGADHSILYYQEDLRAKVKEITGGKGANVIYDPVGGDMFDAATRCLAWEGRLLVIGFTSGRIPELPANIVLLKNSSVVGVYWGAYLQNAPEVIQESFRTLLGWYAQGKLKPHVSQTFPLEKAPDALTALLERRAKGKLAITM